MNTEHGGTLANTESVAGKPPQLNWKFALAVILFAQLMNWMPIFGIAPLLPDIQQEWQMNFTQLGFFSGMMGLVGAGVSISFGMFIARVGVKTSVLLSLGCGALGMIVVALAGDFFVGSVGRAVWAGGYRAAQVALFTAVALLAPKALVASVMGFTMAVSHFAAVIGAPVGGYVGDSFGWRAALDVFAAATVLALLAFLGFFRNRSDQAGSQAEAQRQKSDSAYRSPIVWLLGLLFVFNTMVAGTIVFFVPSVMVQVFGMTTTDVAKTISIAFGLAIPMAIVAGMLSDRFHSYKWVLIGFNIPAMVGTLALISSDPFIFTAATVVVVSMGLATIGLIYALPTTLLPQQEWATANAIITTGASLSSYFGPQLVGLLRDLSGSFTLGWCVLAAAVLAGMVETYLLRVR